MSNKYKYQCKKCNYHTNYKSKWDIHLNSKTHKFGEKQRVDKIRFDQCPYCNYSSSVNTNMKQHILLKHCGQKEKENKFPFYCKLCDFGTFAKSLFDLHNQTDKHRRIHNLTNKK